jgi:photoactive yellow protein
VVVHVVDGARRRASWPDGSIPTFAGDELLDALEGAPLRLFDQLDFGLMVMDRGGEVIACNTYEARRAGMDRRWIVGRNFYVDVGPCPNNELVAARLRECGESRGELDEQLDYVFPYRMAPAPVRLRLLARAGSARQYLAVSPW